MDVVHRDAHFNHEDHGVIGKVGKLVDRFLFVAGLGGNDYLGTLLANLFENFVNTLFKKNLRQFSPSQIFNQVPFCLYTIRNICLFDLKVRHGFLVRRFLRVQVP